MTHDLKWREYILKLQWETEDLTFAMPRRPCGWLVQSQGSLHVLWYPASMFSKVTMCNTHVSRSTYGIEPLVISLRLLLVTRAQSTV